MPESIELMLDRLLLAATMPDENYEPKDVRDAKQKVIDRWQEMDENIKAWRNNLADADELIRSLRKANNEWKDFFDKIHDVYDTGILPDGDHINMPTQLWLERLVKQLEAKIVPCPKCEISMSAGLNYCGYCGLKLNVRCPELPPDAE